MRFYLPCLLLASLAHGQSAPPPDSQVGPGDPVITMNEFCADSGQAANLCQTVITRAQFEMLTEALQPDMPLSLRLTVANSYARNLRMSAIAEKRGLDKTPAFAEEMRFARAQLLAQDLTRALQAESNNITDADLADYYKKNESSYEQATLARIFIPHAKQTAAANGKNDEQEDAHPVNADSQKQAAEDAMTKIAAALRDRAVQGEDPDKLQIEAYTEAGFTRTTANTRMEKVRRATLPPSHEKVMDLKPGEVSEVFSDPAGAHFIYKMIRKETLPFEDVKTEIRAAISSQRYRDSMKTFQANNVFSDAYFIPAGSSAKPPQQIHHGKKIKPAQ